MFDFILERLRKVEWHYMNISCGAYPLDTIDTITPDGQTDTTSSIYSICYGVYFYDKQFLNNNLY